MNLFFISNNAEGGSRTLMPLRTLDFESSASASSATPANSRQKNGGPEGDRTHDLHNAIVALSQLSYRPTNCCKYKQL